MKHNLKNERNNTKLGQLGVEPAPFIMPNHTLSTGTRRYW